MFLFITVGGVISLHGGEPVLQTAGLGLSLTLRLILDEVVIGLDRIYHGSEIIQGFSGELWGIMYFLISDALYSELFCSFFHV